MRDISPTGARAVFEAHGEILTVPAEKGDVRNLTNSPAVAERDPAWSPDGKSIAYFSDESGEYALHIRDQNGLGAVKKIDLGQAAVLLLLAHVVARQQEDRLQRQAAEPLVRGPRSSHAGEGGHGPLRFAPAGIRRAVVARQQVAGLHAATRESHARRFRLFARRPEGHAGHRWHERRALPGFRQERQISLLHRQHEHGPDHGLAGHDEREPSRDAQRLRGRAAEGSAFAARPGKRRGKSRSEEDSRSDANGSANADDQDRVRTRPTKDTGKDTEKKAKKPVKVTIDFEGLSQRILALPIPGAQLLRTDGGQGRRPLLFWKAPLVDVATVPPR